MIAELSRLLDITFRYATRGLREGRSVEYARGAEQKLRQRGKAEAKAMREILETQQKHIASTIAKHQKMDSKQLRLDFGDDEDELRQLEANKRYWPKRLEVIDDKLRSEPERIRELYHVKAQRMEPVGWGQRRIHGELLKLGIRCLSTSSVARILKEYGFDPGPKRRQGTWHEFVQRHLKTLWACDFFTTTIWTLRGPVTCYVLFFVHIGTRRVHLAGVSSNPNGRWMAQQASSLCEFFDTQGDCRPTHIIRDRDSKFTRQFCETLESAGIAFRPTAPRSPNMNPFAETWVRCIKHECLNHFLIFGQRHLTYLIEEYLAHFHEQRPHQGLGNRPPNSVELPAEIRQFEPGQFACRERLGGVLKHYERVAA